MLIIFTEHGIASKYELCIETKKTCNRTVIPLDRLNINPGE